MTEGNQTQQRRFRRPQEMAWDYVRRTNDPALLMEMRLGKTLLVIRALGHRGRVLVSCPMSAISSWERELALEGVQSHQMAVLLGSRASRIDLLNEGRSWNIINHEGWRSVPEIANPPWRWTAIVLDESHAIKNPRAGITKFYLRNFRQVGRRFILTGTLNAESDIEIWTQFAFLNPRACAFGCRTYWDFIARYYRRAPTGFGWSPRLGTPTAIRKEIARRAFVLRRSDCGSDVPKVYERRTIRMPEPIRRMYKRTEREFVSPNGTSETKSSGRVYHWLRQLCGGRVEGVQIWSGKSDELCYLLLGDLSHDPVVVWFFYNDELLSISRRLDALGIKHANLLGSMSPAKRRESLRRFHAGHVLILLAQEAVAGMGMDLSRADTAIYYSTPVSATIRSQTEDRIIDISRKSAHLIVDLVVPNSVDEDAIEIVQGKRARAAWTLERAREIARRRHAC